MSSHGGKFGATSEKNLERVKEPMVRLARVVAAGWNSTVTDGVRTIAEQKKNILKGASQTMDSKHLPRDAEGNLDEDGEAEAIDMIPYPTDWKLVQRGMDAVKAADPSMQVCRHYMYVGFVLGCAHALGINVRPGADWNSNGEVGDHTFIDLPHFELTGRGEA